MGTSSSKTRTPSPPDPPTHTVAGVRVPCPKGAGMHLPTAVGYTAAAGGTTAALPTWGAVEATLSCRSGTQEPLSARWRALQFSRKEAPSASALVRVLVSALNHEVESVLMRHEIAFVLGQTEHASAVPPLVVVMNDEAEDEVTQNLLHFNPSLSNPQPKP